MSLKDGSGDLNKLSKIKQSSKLIKDGDVSNASAEKKKKLKLEKEISPNESTKNIELNLDFDESGRNSPNFQSGMDKNVIKRLDSQNNLIIFSDPNKKPSQKKIDNAPVSMVLMNEPRFKDKNLLPLKKKGVTTQNIQKSRSKLKNYVLEFENNKRAEKIAKFVRNESNRPTFNNPYFVVDKKEEKFDNISNSDEGSVGMSQSMESPRD